jgi:O-antigen/teichoic acid export membrane protein
MMIPGVTAFLGFQLIAVFNQGFSKLDPGEQQAHLVATFLMLVSLILLLTPAAYHRQVERGWVSDGFVRLSSRLIMAATPVFAVGVTIDFYLLVRVVTGEPMLAVVAALVALAITALCWYGLPHLSPLARLLRGPD